VHDAREIVALRRRCRHVRPRLWIARLRWTSGHDLVAVSTAASVASAPPIERSSTGAARGRNAAQSQPARRHPSPTPPTCSRTHRRIHSISAFAPTARAAGPFRRAERKRSIRSQVTFRARTIRWFQAQLRRRRKFSRARTSCAPSSRARASRSKSCTRADRRFLRSEFAGMEIAGLHGSRLYGGSWSEWIADLRG